MTVIAGIFRRIIRLISSPPKLAVFSNSSQYWDDRYKFGGNSGAGSYGRLAHFKAEVLNDFVEKHGLHTVVEFGCGDGAQLELAIYPEYTGFDVSPKAIEICRTKFSSRPHFQFFRTDMTVEKEGSFDLAISLDVIYHLVEDAVFDSYMKRLFESSRNFVIIYSSNIEKKFEVQHVRGRKFTQWCDEYARGWSLFQVIKNRFPYDPALPNETSHSDFYIYQRIV